MSKASDSKWKSNNREESIAKHEWMDAINHILSLTLWFYKTIIFEPTFFSASLSHFLPICHWYCLCAYVWNLYVSVCVYVWLVLFVFIFVFVVGRIRICAVERLQNTDFAFNSFSLEVIASDMWICCATLYVNEHDKKK